MVLVEHLLDHVRKGAVANIVEEGRDARGNPFFGGDPVALAELVEDAGHQMHHSQRMGETRMLRALEGVEGEAKLLDMAQTLKLWRIDQPDQQGVIGPVFRQGDDVVDRIAVESLHN